MKTTFNFRSFWKFLGRHRLYTAINIFGFSVSLAFVILLVVYTLGELSTDRFHANKDRIFMLVDEDNRPGFAPAVAGDVQSRYPEVESTLRVYSESYMAQIKEQKYTINALWVDSTFFRFFSFPIAEGDPQTALVSKTDAIISRDFALKVFGNEDPLGETLTIYNDVYTVSHVVADFKNSQLKNPDIILRFDQAIKYENGIRSLTSFDSNNYSLYLLAYPNADLPSKMPDLLEHFKTFFWRYVEGFSTDVKVVPLTDAYFKVHNGYLLSKKGELLLIRVFLIVAFVILLFAVINYINLSVAQSGFRAPEMSTRRLLGSTRSEIFTRLIIESALLCTVSFGLGLLLALVFEPVFGRMLTTQLDIAGQITPTSALVTAGGVLLLGCISGFIPAWVISRYKPIEVVRGTFQRNTKMVYSKLFIVFQYLISIILIGCTLVMQRQTRHLITADLGHHTENIIIIEKQMRLDRARALKNDLLNIAGVEIVSVAQGTPFNGGNNMSGKVNDDKSIGFQELRGDSSFFKLMGFEVLADYRNAAKDAVWLNETAVREMGLPDTTTVFKHGRRTLQVAGILKDFRSWDMTRPIGPTNVAEFFPWGGSWCILVKVSGSDPFAVYREVERVYKNFTDGDPFEAQFAEQAIRKRYEVQERVLSILGFFTLIAVVISALGILAMATYFIQQRSMEIAVRKVFGSTRNEVLRSLVLRFVKLVLVAFVIAVPVIWILMQKFLSIYNYRIKLTPDIFLLAGGFAVAVALLTVFGQSWRAASTNPAKTIKR